MVPPKPRKGTALTLEGVITKVLMEHHGRLLMDCRWQCVCGWRSERLTEHASAYNHATHGRTEGYAHTAEQIAKALAEQAEREQEETAS